MGLSFTARILLTHPTQVVLRRALCPSEHRPLVCILIVLVCAVGEHEG